MGQYCSLFTKTIAVVDALPHTSPRYVPHACKSMHLITCFTHMWHTYIHKCLYKTESQLHSIGYLKFHNVAFNITVLEDDYCLLSARVTSEVVTNITVFDNMWCERCSFSSWEQSMHLVNKLDSNSSNTYTSLMSSLICSKVTSPALVQSVFNYY